MAVAGGGFRIWVERLREAHDAVRREASFLGVHGGGPLARPSALAVSDMWQGPFADHFRDLIRSLERKHLDPLIDRLLRFASALERLHTETEMAARAELVNLPSPRGFDIFSTLAPWRVWPFCDEPLPPGWEHPSAAGRSGFVLMRTTSVRQLAQALHQSAQELRASRRRLAHGLAGIGFEAPPTLGKLAVAADELATEVVRRVEALEEADRRVAASAQAALASLTGTSARFARLAASARTVRPRTKAQWRAAALERAGIDGKAWGPKKGLLTNDKTVVRVWERYGEFHRGHSELQWAAMANLVGPTFYAGWQDLFCLREADRKARAKLISRLLRLPDNHPLVRAASKSLTANELLWFEERFLIMQRKIFQDLAWQHEAYLAGGIEEMRRLRSEGQLDKESLKNWEDIAGGEPKRVARGNKELLRREQKHVIGDDYTRMRRHHPPVGEVFTRLLTATAENPIPGGHPYRDVVQHLDLPDLPNLPSLPDLPGPLPDLPDLPDLPNAPAVPRGNVARYEDRWEWIEKDMLPAYRKLVGDPDRLGELIQTPIAERAAPQRRLPPWSIRVARRPTHHSVLRWPLAAMLLVHACSGGSADMIDWDLSKSHRPSDIGWDRSDLTSGQIESVASVRIALPEGRVFEAGDEVRDIIYSREGDLLSDIQVTFEEQVAEDAYERATALIREWGLEGRNIDEWFAEARGKTGSEAADVDVSGAFADVPGPGIDSGQLGPGGPVITVRIRYSFEDDRPFLVGFELLWVDNPELG